MKKFIRLMIIPISLCACARMSYAWPPPLMSGECDELCDDLEKSARQISRTSMRGGLMPGCGALPMQRNAASDHYYLTAAHCVGDDNLTLQRAKERQHLVYLFPFDANPDEEKNLNESVAKVVAVGMQSKNDDCAILRVKKENMNGEEPRIFTITSSRAKTRETFVAYSGPGGAGLQFLPGWVSKAKHGLPIRDPNGEINWEDGMFIQMLGAWFGSSGTPLVSVKRGEIIGILVGIYPPANAFVALPADRCLRFWEEVQNDAYPYFKMDPADKP